MAAKIITSLAFRASTLEGLKGELTTFAGNLYDFAGNLVREFAARPSVSPLNPTTLAFGRLHKFTLDAADILDVQLPRPDPLNGGLMIHITRSSKDGIIVIHATDGSLLNGRESLRLPAAPGMYFIGFDSENYYSAPSLAMDWGDGLP